jgi:hypothetical protein
VLAEETRMPMTRVPTEHRPVNYRGAALAHYSVIFPPIAAAALIVVSWAVALAVLFVGELLIIGILPRFGTFRRSVDARFERCVAAALRLDVLERMSAAHRADFENVERLAGKVREHCVRLEESGRQGPPDLTVERWLGLDRLVAIYAELAVAHRRSTEAFLSEDLAALEVERDQVRVLASTSRGPTSALLQRRSVILQRRYETWMEAAAERELLVQGLATIIDVVRWMHELCGVVAETLTRADLDDVLESWEANGATLREVSGLCRSGATAVDPRLLALGREELALRREGGSWDRTTEVTRVSESNVAPLAPQVQPSQVWPLRA